MKLIVRRGNLNPEDTPSDVLIAPLVIYGPDGDNALHYHLYDDDGKRLGGGIYAPEAWTRISESEPVGAELFTVWAKAQNAAAGDPNVIPVLDF